MTEPTASDAIIAIEQLTQEYLRWNKEFLEWLNGQAGGGPNSDGRYPLTGIDRQVRHVLCPEALEDTISGPATEAEVSAQEAQDVLQQVELVKSAIESIKNDIDTALFAVEEAKNIAEVQASNAQNASSAATNAVNLRFPSTSVLRIPQSSTPQPGDDLGSFRWNSSGLFFNTPSGWRKIKLEIIE